MNRADAVDIQVHLKDHPQELVESIEVRAQRVSHEVEHGLSVVVPEVSGSARRQQRGDGPRVTKQGGHVEGGSHEVASVIDYVRPPSIEPGLAQRLSHPVLRGRGDGVTGATTVSRIARGRRHE